MAARKKPLINLLPQEEFETSTSGRLLKWLLATFRYIVIVTELIVMVAFISRFWLDAKNNDLDDLLKQKRAVVEASARFEKDFRQTQTKLKVFSGMTTKAVETDKVLGIASSYLPPEIYLTSFSLTGKDIRIRGVAPSERSVAVFIANLNSTDVFDDISLFQADSLGEGGSLLNFTLRATLKES